MSKKKTPAVEPGRNQYDELAPLVNGRVAALVMGFAWDERHARWQTPGGLREFSPAYAIADAYEVVLQMNTRGYAARLLQPTATSSVWQARFVPEEGGVAQFDVAPTLPLVICLAALRAINRL